MFGLTLVIATISVVASTIPALAGEEGKPPAELTASFLSQSIWRGKGLSQGSLVIQPSMTAGFKGFSAGEISYSLSLPYDHFHDGLLSTILRIPVTKHIGILPQAYSSLPLSHDALRPMEAGSINGDDDQFFYAGIAISFAF